MMNAEAEKWIADHEEEWLLEHCDKDLMREAMRFAYADAARVCEAERKMIEHAKGLEMSCVRGALSAVEQAILARASKPGG